MKNLFIYFLICLSFSLYAKNTSLPQKNKCIIWAFSDLQPRNEKECDDFKRAVDDVLKNKLEFTFAIVPGDIAQNPSGGQTFDVWDWYFGQIGRCTGKQFFEITGNHDARKLDEYLERVKKPLHYYVTYGNLLIICLSDEIGTSGTEVSDDVIAWWKKLVETNQDKIIITVTHSHLKGSGFFYNVITYRNVAKPKKYTKVLKKNNVDLWLFGHTHVPTGYGDKTLTCNNLGGTTFVNVGAIRRDFFVSHTESRFFEFVDGSDVVFIRTRNHDKQKDFAFYNYKIKLSKAFKQKDKKLQMVPYKKE